LSQIANPNGFTTTVSGGFAVVQPDSQLSINAVEGYPLEDFSADVGFVRRCDSTIDTDGSYRLSATRSPSPRRLPTAAAASRILLRLRLSLRYEVLISDIMTVD
jgi:hypothetical protein